MFSVFSSWSNSLRPLSELCFFYQSPVTCSMTSSAIPLYTWADSRARAVRILADAVELTHSRVFSCHVHGLCQQILPVKSNIHCVISFQRDFGGKFKLFSYLLVLFSISSQRSSATRKTDFRLMGTEMEWTRPSSTSSTSSWLLHTQTELSAGVHSMNKISLI